MRVDRAVTAVQTRFALLFPDGESLDAGRATWTLSSTPLLVADGVIRYDATDFHGPDSERDLDNCLAVLSTYDVPWRFSAWEHLGADLLVPQLVARGMTGTNIAEAMWLDLGGRPELGAEDEGVDVRPAKTPSYHQAWTQIFTKVFGTPSSPTSSSKWSPAPTPMASSPMPTIGRHLLEAANSEAVRRGATASVVVANRAGSALCAGLGPPRQRRRLPHPRRPAALMSPARTWSPSQTRLVEAARRRRTRRWG
ncbi:MAG: hypothetical protein ABI899_11065 [Actinomycetota bacterium]